MVDTAVPPNRRQKNINPWNFELENYNPMKMRGLSLKLPPFYAQLVPDPPPKKKHD